jgi:DNA-binding transcriptional MerR regulator
VGESEIPEASPTTKQTLKTPLVAQYAIKDLEQLSGIKAHTIRIWEQRYGILKPQRSGANVRLYGDSDLKILLEVALLNEKGFKISKIAAMSPVDLSDQVQLLIENAAEIPVLISALVLASLEFSEARLDRIFTIAVKHLGFENGMNQVIFPFLETIGYGGKNNSISPVHVNFAANLICRKLQAVIDQFPLPDQETSPRFLLFTADTVQDETTLLFMHYLLRVRKYPVLFLGKNLPFEALQTAAEIYQPDFLLTVLPVLSDPDPIRKYLVQLSTAFPDKLIFIFGVPDLSEFSKIPFNIKLLQDFTGFTEALALL